MPPAWTSPAARTMRTRTMRYRDIDQTLAEMRRLVRTYRVHPVIRRAALDAVMEYASIPLGEHGYADLAAHPDRVAAALWLYVAERVAYVADPYRTELVQSPDLTLALGMGDCDDLTVLIEALAQSLGLATRAVVAGFDDDGFDHVWPEAKIEDSWQPLDVTIAAPGGITGGLVQARIYDADDGLTWEGAADALYLETFPTIDDDTDMDRTQSDLGSPGIPGGGIPGGGLPGLNYNSGFPGGFGFDPTGGAGGFNFDPTGGAGGFGFDPTGGAGGFGFDFGGGNPFGDGGGFGFQSNFSIPGLGEITAETLSGWLGVFDQLAQTLGWGRYGGGGLGEGEVIVTDPRTGTRYVVPEEQAQELAEQGVFQENADGSYSVNPQAPQQGPQGPRFGQQQQSGLFGSLSGVLLVGAAVALGYQALRKK